MSETAVIGVLITACFALIGAIYAVIQARQTRTETSLAKMGERLGSAEAEIATLKSQNARQERDVVELQKQNTTQEASIAGLVQRMVAREDAHAVHREDTQTQFSRVEAMMAEISRKLDRLLQPPGSRTPFPAYRGDKPPEQPR